MISSHSTSLLPCHTHCSIHPSEIEYFCLSVCVLVDLDVIRRTRSLTTPGVEILTVINKLGLCTQRARIKQRISGIRHIPRQGDDHAGFLFPVLDDGILLMFIIANNCVGIEKRGRDDYFSNNNLSSNLFTDIYNSSDLPCIPPHYICVEKLEKEGYFKVYSTTIHSIYLRLDTKFSWRLQDFKGISPLVPVDNCNECKYERVRWPSSCDLLLRSLMEKHSDMGAYKVSVESDVQLKDEGSWRDEQECMEEHWRVFNSLNKADCVSPNNHYLNALLYERKLEEVRRGQERLNDIRTARQQLEGALKLRPLQDEVTEERDTSVALTNVIKNITPNNQLGLTVPLAEVMQKLFFVLHEISYATDGVEGLMLIDGIPIPNTALPLHIKSADEGLITAADPEAARVLISRHPTERRAGERRNDIVVLLNELQIVTGAAVPEVPWVSDIPIDQLRTGLRQLSSLLDHVAYFTNATRDIEVHFAFPYEGVIELKREPPIGRKGKRVAVEGGEIFAPTAIIDAMTRHIVSADEARVSVVSHNLTTEFDIRRGLALLSQTSRKLLQTNGVSDINSKDILFNAISTLVYHPLRTNLHY